MRVAEGQCRTRAIEGSVTADTESASPRGSQWCNRVLRGRIEIGERVWRGGETIELNWGVDEQGRDNDDSVTQKRCKGAAPGSVGVLGTPRGRSDACADA